MSILKRDYEITDAYMEKYHGKIKVKVVGMNASARQYTRVYQQIL